MTRAILLGTTGIAVAFGMLAFGYMAGQTGASRAAPTAMVAAAPDRAAVEAIVRSYLLENPEILADMQALLEEKQREEERLARYQTIKDAGAEIFNASYDGLVGNPDGKTTIVEFYDYNCGYCKRAQEDMLALTAADPDLRFVLKEFPILGPDSHKASTVSMAFLALMPAQHAEFHNRLMSAPGRATEDSAIRIAVSLGADEAALRQEMANPAINQAFARTYELANQLAITGTPSYVVGTEVIYGALGRDVLAEKIETVRATN